ncbi:hypothetical protein AB205_0213680 [Aquarana catesbeiana]|uniref:Uncharacterized protein n=1 Tax=Aquarana catesbeiana TaxID=8400 RepID=A0A2G9Q2X8_AQUCT|nr:hypothetical protein AB205_0213680 [Aquarana catesbeiana]
MAKVVKSLHRNFLVWDTRTPFLLGGPHRCSSVYYRGVSICEACTKQVSIEA